jgi:phosphopantothenoylcysteine decarboxylase/phosphopantothenate--cysteine ligase
MNIVLGVSASIAAYKSVDLLRALQKQGHGVTVVLTDHARQFVSTLVLETFAPGRVFHDQFAVGQNPVLHIDLSRDNDLLVIAPATANMIAKMAGGLADDLLSTVFVAFRRKVLVVPAMNTHMYEHATVTANLIRLREMGVLVMEPESGELACGDTGKGRFPEISAIAEQVGLILS